MTFLGSNAISGFSNAAAQTAQKDAKEGSAQTEAIETATAIFQTKLGRLQMLLKINEALAKMFKSLGDAVKGLV
jgi:hypothetical protein